MMMWDYATRIDDSHLLKSGIFYAVLWLNYSFYLDCLASFWLD